jgi:hypothetical protein
MSVPGRRPLSLAFSSERGRRADPRRASSRQVDGRSKRTVRPPNILEERAPQPSPCPCRPGVFMSTHATVDAK